MNKFGNKELMEWWNALGEAKQAELLGVHLPHQMGTLSITDIAYIWGEEEGKKYL